MKSVLNNTNRITFGSFLAYFVMSAILSPLGVISGPIAEHFDISITAATAAFTYLTTGILAGTFAAVFIFDVVPLRQVVIGGAIGICFSIGAIYALDMFTVFSLGLALIGTCCGVELSAAAVAITKTFEHRLRASMLLLTDSFYSMAGVVSTSLAGLLIARQFHWTSAYLLAFVASIGIAVIAATSKYPATAKHEFDPGTESGDKSWPLGVHLLGLSLFVYLIGFVSIYSWIPNYAQAAFGLDIESSSQIVGRLFLGMFIGQLIMFFLVLKFPLRILIITYAAMATLMTASLWTVQSALHLQIAMLVLGLATGGLLKTVMTYGTTLVGNPSPKMVSYLVFHAGFGTAVAPFVSSLIVERSNMSAALKFATFCYVLMLTLLLLAHFLKRRDRDPQAIPKTNFDQNTEAFAADPWSQYAELRSSCPVAHTDAHGGFWVLSKYQDVVRVAKDDITFSSVPTTVIPDSGVYNLIPLQSDPPDLQRYRAALLPYFTAKAVEEYAPRIRQFTTTCIDAFIHKGECELVTELANPVPSMTALKFIGFDPAHWHDFAGPMHQLSYSADGSAARAEALQDLKEIDDRIDRAIADRRGSPADDAITHLIKYEKDGVVFSDKELHGLIKMLLFGGLDTTMAAMSNALLYLSENREQRQRLIDDASLIPMAVDEFLRIEAPVHAFSRNVTTDTEIGGQQVRAGEKVYLLWASANRDADQFENPDDVILNRRPNRHLTFGIGGHRCLGALLARLELKIMLEEVLRRIPDFRIDLERVKHPKTVTIIWGRSSLPATFTAIS